ncbi:large ribosomal subunit protein uL16-like [Macaca fascicularis]|uniref:large ribosomal subunit protein uL16-like n=1 Tax=Macaca fascicularis TaxID=9541 RepID=UPI0003AB698B|nr:PREDICTED: 60S ribosomal protein L10-like [Macaca fascicularis]XP_024646939.1 60S ribosomal protein L10-like [Macaca nemestrina]
MAANSSFLGGVHGLFLIWVALRVLGDRPFKCMFMSLTLHYPQCRLQTGIQGAFGKPQGTVARVHIGQVIMSICTKLQNKEHMIEALCRAKFKFPGRQKIHISKKWGFTKFNVDECEDMVAEKQLIPDGCRVKYIPNHGPLDEWQVLHW